jgi:hypothetical protein
VPLARMITTSAVFRSRPPVQGSTQERARVEAAGWGGPNLWFVRVPEPKTAMNRQHFDLRPTGTHADEVDLGSLLWVPPWSATTLI